ncbi:MAG: hypothetical protein WCP95_00235 [Actinomycetes bacterium]
MELAEAQALPLSPQLETFGAPVAWWAAQEVVPNCEVADAEVAHWLVVPARTCDGCTDAVADIVTDVVMATANTAAVVMIRILRM